MKKTFECSTSARYCGFEQIADYPTHIEEKCKFCGKEVRYQKRGERIDNKQYLEDHVRDFCQPIGPTQHVYLYVYGEEGYKRRQKLMDDYESKHQSKEAAIDQGIAESKETLKIWKRLQGKGMIDSEIIRELRKEQ